MRVLTSSMATTLGLKGRNVNKIVDNGKRETRRSMIDRFTSMTMLSCRPCGPAGMDDFRRFP
jgi:hypothetical protein